MLALIAATPSASAAAPVIRDARIGDHTSKTRFVLEMSAPLAFQAFTLADPYRVVIDLPEVSWRLKSAAQAGGVITAFRYGLFEPGKSRLVLDVNAPVRVAKSFVLRPAEGLGYRLVIDLRRVDRKTFLDTLRRRPARLAPRHPAPPVAKPRRRPGEKIVVAVDPGHGGIDPGTIGVTGSREKSIVLGFARELRRQLAATGRYRVVLTRDRDVYVPLRKRIDIARAAGAELFVSLHADSLGDSKVRGGSIYTLSERASDKEAAALAAKENKADVIAGVDLNGQSPEVATILIDLAQRNAMNESADFARTLTRELGKTVRLLRNTHRFAGFAVLKAPDVPSVLVELGYLSNRTDERLLKQKRHRKRASAAIVRAINRYFADLQAARRQ